jgi:hypothetical protein
VTINTSRDSRGLNGEPSEQAKLTQVTGRYPELAALAGHITGFAEMLTGRHHERLDAWIAAASAFLTCAPSLPASKRDHDAVRNGLTYALEFRNRQGQRRPDDQT